ncbi:putative enzyme related to lactoylglutathione lyase [Asanoa ferruginea]|uniref:Putative enzyme related to lactoylglutathione lyase n=1 Tax=Asanoa ferruginea TaxID=53367 RepID=A0A3D9ZXU9_9ACTN|nr:VOC family protein [Asanoa ferruginea]REG01976.1 putative enzyme related to lactoylglutathione lyase [Asanoa ferruginea]GIF49915.1 glyoxalase [Asanoa ferruginea]
MFRGIATVNYWTDDLAAAKKWYSEVLGIEPYFEVPGGYAEFRLGDYQQELGLIDRAFAPDDAATRSGGVVAYWHVDDIDAALDRLTSLGATVREQPRDRGKGFITATVTDPFDNILGIMFNPHYVDVLGGKS